MKTKIQTYTALLVSCMMIFQMIIPMYANASINNDEVIYPLKEISKLNCRFENFDTLASNCKQNLPILHSKDYEKYASKNGGYNDYTRIYTMLWGASYKYGWDVGNGGHQGNDIATAKGTPVYAIANGKVIESSTDVSWGKYISIEHIIRGKKVISNYAHLSKLLVKKGDIVKIGKNIAEVGSTGNSTGNHLHFQIDLPAPFHPYYYDWNACPYSYYEITEKGVCFDELVKNTFDPLVFLETNGAVLDTIDVSKRSQTQTKRPIKNTLSNIFSITISPEYGSRDEIKEVQKIYKDLGYYKGNISGKYTDLEKSLINYQVQTGVIQSKSSQGAGWFGPKTRKQTQSDYNIFLKTGEESTREITKSESNGSPSKITTIKKIPKAKLLTREEIEGLEIQGFLKKYNIKFKSAISQIDENTTQETIIEIKNSKGKGFRGNTPGKLSFSFDESKISVFPKSFYNFTKGERTIRITGKKSGLTTLNVKIGDVIVKTFSITVGKKGEKKSVDSAQIYTDTRTVLGAENTAILVMRDNYGNKLVRKKYEGKFKLDSSEKVLYCIKKGSISDIKSIYARNCYDNEYSESLEFSYQDTIGGLLVFDYKILNSDVATIQVQSLKKQKDLTKKSIAVFDPKGLLTSYQYYNEVIESISSGISNGLKNDYFQENMSLSQADASKWIENILSTQDSYNKDTNISPLDSTNKNSTAKISRKDFLLLVHKYLGNSNESYGGKEYKDLDSEEESLVASLLGENYSWKDKFGERYFQPDKEITRGEATYMLSSLLKKNGRSYLALQ